MKASEVSKYIAKNNPPWRWPYQALKGLGYQVFKKALAKPITIRLFNGKRIRLYPDCPTSHQFFYTNIPDKKEIEVLRTHGKGATFIDVGANIGSYSVMLGDVVDRIIAFEPDETAYYRLRDNLHMNGLKADIEQMALSNYRGQSQFSKSRGLPTNSLLNPHEDGVLVQVSTLDHYADKFNLPIEPKYLLKIDVEGEELQVLKGAKFFLQTYAIVGILIEVQAEHLEQVKQFIHPLGFNLTCISNDHYWATQK